MALSRNDIVSINLSEQEIIKTIYLLQEEGYISLKEKSVHDDLSRYWNVELKSSCIHYFENKRENRIMKKRDWIKTYVPIIISILALVKSFLPEITLVMEEILKLIKR